MHQEPTWSGTHSYQLLPALALCIKSQHMTLCSLAEHLEPGHLQIIVQHCAVYVFKFWFSVCVPVMDQAKCGDAASQAKAA